MNHLIIFAHPNSQKSFGRAIVDRVVKASQQLGVETHLRDLYTMEFNPIISFEELQSVNKGIIPAEIQQEHDFIRQADLIYDGLSFSVMFSRHVERLFGSCIKPWFCL